MELAKPALAHMRLAGPGSTRRCSQHNTGGASSNFFFSSKAAFSGLRDLLSYHHHHPPEAEAGIVIVLGVVAVARLSVPHQQGPSPTHPCATRRAVQTRLSSHAARRYGARRRARTRAGDGALSSGQLAQDRALLVPLHDHGQRSLARPGDTRDCLYRIPGPLDRVLCT